MPNPDHFEHWFGERLFTQKVPQDPMSPDSVSVDRSHKTLSVWDDQYRPKSYYFP